MKKPLIILTGPTAVGKTELSIALAKRIGGEIISADSMQVYKYMDIGSAKIMPAEQQGIPHHLIDLIMPEHEFHVVEFQRRAKKCIEEIYERGNIPIIVGGTGFYIQAVLYDIDFTTSRCNDDFRKELEQLKESHGACYLHEMLEKVDPNAAKQIHANNSKRVIRALEFYHETGKQISQHNEAEKHKTSPYDFAYFVLNDERDYLYERINQRVDIMLSQGLVDEVKMLKEKGYTRALVSMQGLGYKELFAYLDNECTLEEAVYLIKRDSRHFAKRQLTWFKREREVIWLDKSTYQRDNKQLLERILEILDEKDIC